MILSGRPIVTFPWSPSVSFSTSHLLGYRTFVHLLGGAELVAWELVNFTPFLCGESLHSEDHPGEMIFVSKTKKMTVACLAGTVCLGSL